MYAREIIVDMFQFTDLDQLIEDDGYCLSAINDCLQTDRERWMSMLESAQEEEEEEEEEEMEESSDDDDEEELKACSNSKHERNSIP